MIIINFFGVFNQKWNWWSVYLFLLYVFRVQGVLPIFNEKLNYIMQQIHEKKFKNYYKKRSFYLRIKKFKKMFFLEI